MICKECVSSVVDDDNKSDSMKVGNLQKCIFM